MRHYETVRHNFETPREETSWRNKCHTMYYNRQPGHPLSLVSRSSPSRSAHGGWSPGGDEKIRAPLAMGFWEPATGRRKRRGAPSFEDIAAGPSELKLPGSLDLHPGVERVVWRSLAPFEAKL